jgi:hypothetical protein
MNLLKLKIALSLVAIFGLGFATGLLVKRQPMVILPAPQTAAGGTKEAARVDPYERAERAASRWRDQRLAELKARLSLTEEQIAAHERIMDELVADYLDLKGEMTHRFGMRLTEANKQFAAELTPAQRKVFWQHIRSKASD